VIYLWWDNFNNTNDHQFIWTDIWSTTNLNVAFHPRFKAPPFTKWVEVATTNQMEFFIARFAMTNGSAWEYSDWSRH